MTHPCRVVLEGNIGAGKSSLGRLMQNLDPLTFKFYPEPTELWHLEGGRDILKDLYQRTPGAGFLAQTLISQTVLVRDLQLNPAPVPVGLYERSLSSAKMCFIPAMLDEGLITQTEAEVLNLGYAFNTSHWSQLTPDRIVYVRCEPDQCMNRLATRGGVEPGRVSQFYVKRLHELHDNWLLGRHDVITLNTTAVDKTGLRHLAHLLTQQLPPCESPTNLSSSSSHQISPLDG